MEVRRSALIAFIVHLVAGLAMAAVLRHGLETTPDLQARLAFLVNHRAAWTAAWLTWTVAAIAILYFYSSFADAYQSPRLAVLLTVAALASDLSSQAIEIGVLPSLASEALGANGNAGAFLQLHRIAVVLSGYLANGLYSTSALILAYTARRIYPAWITASGLAVAAFGFALSVAALMDSIAGMFWTNVFLVPSLLLWLGALAIIPPMPGWKSGR
jgi:hypothetical protein